MKKFFIAIFVLFWTTPMFCQIPIGQFRAHIPLHRFHSVAVSEKYVYAATDNGLMLLDKSTKDDPVPTLSAWTKVDGLSDIDIAKISYDSLSSTLIISYIDGNLDFVKNDKLTNVSDIKNKQITGSKELQHIRTNGQLAYLVYPFGVVVIDLSNYLITDTWFTKRGTTQYNAEDIAITDDDYFLSTERGIFRISKNNSTPSNFLLWTNDTPADSSDFDNILYFGGKVYANKNCNDPDATPIKYDTLYIRDQDVWTPTTLAYYDVRDMSCNATEMAICNWEYVELFNANLGKTYHAEWIQDATYEDTREAVIDHNIIWIADNNNGLAQVNRTYYFQKIYTSDGPYSNNVENICSQNGITVLVPGSMHGAAYTESYLYPSISWFSNQKWQTNASSFLNYTSGHETYDLNNVIINPNDDSEWYISSWRNGLYKCKNGIPVAHYGPENSLLDSTSAGNTFVSGLAFDDKNNLWMTNSYTSKMLKMMEPNGTWHEYNIGSGVITSDPTTVVAQHLLVDSRGYKWITYPRDDSYNKYHLVAFTDNGTYDNTGDDQFARVDMNAKAEVNSSTVYCIAEDLEGQIWIGTDKGIKVIASPANVFKGTAYPQNIILYQDGYYSVLFEFEEITAIAVDGANRKWIGTSKAGVFLMSSDGQEQLLHFTAEDNPLFSNQIVCITIDPLSGEVFFGTSKGVVSYRGSAITGKDTYEDLLVFPNPVRHGYTGTVAVKGMKTNSLCKITDASGKMIWQGYSKGGELIWNCLDYFGKRPATGVYFVMASDEDGNEKIVTKFLFIH